MSNVYNLEPPTKGKVVLHTTLGDLDIELWPKEAPKAVRNFVQLCLEGYYDNTIFHRVIRDYMVQGGDPTGTGTGGESSYGTMFKDEFHQRLKFNHRGLVACANQNAPHTNASQFFISLDKCEWLDKKNTIFGKVVGDTIFNLSRYNDVDTDPESDRPYEAPRITSCEVLANPFEDIVPRVQRPSLLQQQQQEQIKKEKEAAARRPSASKGKNLALLSFGEQAEEDEAGDEAAAAQLPSKRIRAAHDVLSDKRLVPGEETPAEERINVEVSAADRERSRAALDRTRAVLAGQGAGARTQEPDEEEPDGAGGVKVPGDSQDFAARMLDRIKDKRVALGDAPREGKPPRAPPPPRQGKSPESGGEEEEEEEDSEEAGGAGRGGPQGAAGVRARRAEELENIKREKRAYGKMQAGSIEVADAALLKPWQVSRERYKQRKQLTGSREKDTLARLAAFASKLQANKEEEAATDSKPKEAALVPQEEAKAASTVKEDQGGYNGKVRDDIDHKAYMPPEWRVDDYLDGDFLDTSLEDLKAHQLSFAKTTGRREEQSGIYDAENYVVFDPLLEKNKGKFSKANQKEKKRENAWAGKSNT